MFCECQVSGENQKLLTCRGRNSSVSLNVNTASRIIRWKLEVADSDARKAIECLKRYNFGECHVIEDRPKCHETKFRRGDRPIKARVVQEECGELSEAGRFDE
jgi:hypothetical protein